MNVVVTDQSPESHKINEDIRKSSLNQSFSILFFDLPMAYRVDTTFYGCTQQNVNDHCKLISPLTQH